MFASALAPAAHFLDYSAQMQTKIQRHGLACPAIYATVRVAWRFSWMPGTRHDEAGLGAPTE
jgi:hypothetical protein